MSEAAPTVQELLLKRRRMVVVPKGAKNPHNQAVFLAHLFELGYVVDNPDGYSDEILKTYPELIATLKELRGGADHVPLYSNFPDEVPEPDEYFLKRLLGYVIDCSKWDVPGEKAAGVTVPKWLFDLELFGADPISQRQDLRLFLREKYKQLTRRGEKARKPTTLTFIPEDKAESELTDWLRWSLTSKTSFPEVYRGDLKQALNLLPDVSFSSEELSFREHRAVYMAHLWKTSNWDELVAFCENPTDVLRLLVQLTGGDVSLSNPVTFPKLKRAERRRVLGFLNQMGERSVVIDQLQKYRGLWLALERSLHSGEYKKLFPVAYKLLSLLREGKLRPQFSELEMAYERKDKDAVLECLNAFPGGVSLRRFCQTLSLSGDTLENLMPKVKRAALKDQLTLKQVLERDAVATEALILTKRGATRVIPRRPDRIDGGTRKAAVTAVSESIAATIQERFGHDSWSGKNVFIDPELKRWMVPTALRSASDALTVLGRGSIVKLGDQSTLRMFVYWKQHFKTTDLDLSAVSFDEDFRCTGHVSWTNLKSGGMVHSGDLQSAPFGAAEFIDAKIDVLKESGHRYLGMLVYRYCGEYFSELDCYCGWMMRDKPDANYKTFDIATVEQKLVITGEVTYALPVLFDLHGLEALWFDLRVYGTDDHNAVENTWGRLEQLVRVGSQMKNWKLNLYQLASLHTELRGGESVDEFSKADISFTVGPRGDYHPGDWSRVLSELL